MTSKKKITRKLSVLSQASHQSQLKYQYGPHTTIITLTLHPASLQNEGVVIHSSTITPLESKLIESFVYSMIDARFRYPGKILLFTIEQVGVLDITLGSIFESVLFSLLASGLEIERTLVPVVICKESSLKNPATNQIISPNEKETDRNLIESQNKWKIYQPKFSTPETETSSIYNTWDTIILYTFEQELMVSSYLRSGTTTLEELESSLVKARKHVSYQRNVIRVMSQKFFGPH